MTTIDAASITTNNNNNNPDTTAYVPADKDHSACGVGAVVQLSGQEATHDIVNDGVAAIAEYKYRSGENLVTGESDGAGIEFVGLPTPFFKKKEIAAQFDLRPVDENISNLLVDKHYAIGQYFMPKNQEECAAAMDLVESTLQDNGFHVAGWRDVNARTNKDAVSEIAWNNKPSIRQAIIVANKDNTSVLNKDGTLKELRVMRAALDVYSQADEKKIQMNIISQSSKFIIYKGMVLPDKMADFFKDLQHEDFTAKNILMHARYATNTAPKDPNAQPCHFTVKHNGEFNSAAANAIEMINELNVEKAEWERTHPANERFPGIYPNSKLSDSMQFDADIANHMVLRDCTLAEALVRLMPPTINTDAPQETKDMLNHFSLRRTSYNGPATLILSDGDNVIVATDKCGLRPCRWAIVDIDGKQKLYAGSDDMVPAHEEKFVTSRGHLNPGSMMMITPDGKIQHTAEILEGIRASHKDISYTKLVNDAVTPLKPVTAAEEPVIHLSLEAKNRQRFASGLDHEDMQALMHLAKEGAERVGAMGDDTNPFHANRQTPVHISAFMHQLFAQVSAPALDSVKETDYFMLATTLGGRNNHQIGIKSPILGKDDLYAIEHNTAGVNTHILDTSFNTPTASENLSTEETAKIMQDALRELLKKAEEAALKGGILILSDRHASAEKALIPDVIAVAAVKRHLEEKNLIRNISIIADSTQAADPHHAATLLAFGARGFYPRTVYEKIHEEYAGTENDTDAIAKGCKNYQKGVEKGLLKTMGKFGITDFNNYSGGVLVAAFGLDLTTDKDKSLVDEPTLANIFPKVYSPMKGINLGHIANYTLVRHRAAYATDRNFTIMPRSGEYMPEKNGVKHGYGPEVVNAFIDMRKQETDTATLCQMDRILAKKGMPGYVDNSSMFAAEKGFLDPAWKREDGTYDPAKLENFQPSDAYRQFSKTVEEYRQKNPTSISDYLSPVDLKKQETREKLGLGELTIPAKEEMQSQASIRGLLYSGGMSQGALTVTDPDTPDKIGAHETLTRGLNAVGAQSAAGEGGEAPEDLVNSANSARSKQVASGRFGVSALQIMNADEIQIKVAQGAKPGEGGQLPGAKISIRLASQRGSLPDIDLISPPPHHDIYSIEDLAQLIHDIKSVNSKVKVDVKLVASEGIGTIAVGVAKAGADSIDIAGNSGGTGAAQQSSIKHAGLPAEIGLAEVTRALRQTRLFDTVELRTSGGFKDEHDVIKATMLGAKHVEFGTSFMIAGAGCVMQRTCNQSCSPGVATDGHLFQGNQINIERYVTNIAAATQEWLQQHGFKSLDEIRGRTDLLHLTDKKMAEQYDFNFVLDRNNLPALLTEQEKKKAHEEKEKLHARPKEDKLINEIWNSLKSGKSYSSELITINRQDRSFGARIAGTFAQYLEKHPELSITLNTEGTAGQSFGFVTPKGMILNHKGIALDGCGKSMNGGTLVLSTPDDKLYKSTADENTIAGNAALYGASSGEIFLNGATGHRTGILLKGAQLTAERVGELALEYMTSGTALILSSPGKGFATGASAGIALVYDDKTKLNDEKGIPTHMSDAVRLGNEEEKPHYKEAIRAMLIKHTKLTNSIKGQEILADFDNNYSKFKIVIPKQLDNINTIHKVSKVIATYNRRQVPITAGMQVWLEQTALRVVGEQLSMASSKDIAMLSKVLGKKIDNPEIAPLSSDIHKQLTVMIEQHKEAVREAAAAAHAAANGEIGGKHTRPLFVRVNSIKGLTDNDTDKELKEILNDISAYAHKLKTEADGCSECRSQGCSGGKEVDTGCPGGKSINTLNGTLKGLGQINSKLGLTAKQWGTLRQAFEVQIATTPFIGYTGIACPAPCESNCTQGIPEKTGALDPARGGKPVGKPVQIKSIEYRLFQLGRMMNWFDGTELSNEKQASLFKSQKFLKQHSYDAYQAATQEFRAPFELSAEAKASREANIENKRKLVIVGSGPAAMQTAFQALHDGMDVHMYEQSDKPGGLLQDGIPAHKFDKLYIKENFDSLKKMGLNLYLDQKVSYDTAQQAFTATGKDGITETIAVANNPDHQVALCIGASKPRELVATNALPEDVRDKTVFQAVKFLKKANDFAALIAKQEADSIILTAEQRDQQIKDHFGDMDPRKKKILVIGAGDTSQDVMRWIARYFSDPNERGGLESIGRSAPKGEISYENELRREEVKIVGGTESYHVNPKKIDVAADGSLQVTLEESKYKYIENIQNDDTLKKLHGSLPQEKRPMDKSKELHERNVDMIIVATGFETNGIKLVEQTKGLSNVFLAGDAADTKQKIIISAQASANDTYAGKFKPKSNEWQEYNHARIAAPAVRAVG